MTCVVQVIQVTPSPIPGSPSIPGSRVKGFPDGARTTWFFQEPITAGEPSRLPSQALPPSAGAAFLCKDTERASEAKVNGGRNRKDIKEHPSLPRPLKTRINNKRWLELGISGNPKQDVCLPGSSRNLSEGGCSCPFCRGALSGYGCWGVDGPMLTQKSNSSCSFPRSDA